MSNTQYSPNNLPLGVMMLTGGVAGSIAEVHLCQLRLSPFHSILPKSDYKFKANRPSTMVCSTVSRQWLQNKASPHSIKGSVPVFKDKWSSPV